MLSPAVPAFLFLGGAILLGYAAKRAYARTRVSEIAVLLGCGALLGPLLGWVQPEAVAPALAILAPLGLVVVLFEGGLGLGWSDLKAHGARGARVGLLTWATSAASVAIAARLALGMSWPVAALLGLALAATGILVVITLLDVVRAPSEARVILTLETSFGDLLSVVAVTALAATLVGNAAPAEGARLLATKFAVGAAAGVVAGLAWARVLHTLGRDKNAYGVTLGALTLAYATVEILGGSGFLAALAFGVVVANAERLRAQGVPKLATLDREARGHQSEFIFILKSFYFVAMGASVSLAAMSGGVLLGALAIVAALALARFAAVNLALGRKRPDESAALRTLLVGSMPRGLATALIAGIPAAMGVPGTESFLAVTFLVIIGMDLLTTGGVLLYERRRESYRPAPLGARAPAASTAVLLETPRR